MRKSEKNIIVFAVKPSQHCRNLRSKLRALRALAIANPITWCSHPCHKLLHWTSDIAGKHFCQHWCRNVPRNRDLCLEHIYFQSSKILSNSASSSMSTKICRLLSWHFISASTGVTSSPRTHQDEISLLWQGLRSQGNSWWMPSKRTIKIPSRCTKKDFKHQQTDCRHCPKKYGS